MSHPIHDIRRHPVIVCLIALIGCAALSPAAFSADKAKGPEISRSITKEMTAAQKAMQASQWNEALKNLEAAEQKSPLTAYDKLKIDEFKANCYVRLNNLKAAQTSYEAMLATGALPPEELPKHYRALFQLAASNQQGAKAIEYGKQAFEAGSMQTIAEGGWCPLTMATGVPGYSTRRRRSERCFGLLLSFFLFCGPLD